LIDASSNVFLCDFGFSRIRHEITRTLTNIREGGRTRFLAPELLAGTEKFRTSTASDIYSLSMTFFSTWARTLPFCELFNEYKVQKHIRKGRRPKRPTTQIGLPAEMEQGFWQLIVDMWAHDPSSRPSTDDMQRRLEATFGFLLEEHERARIG
jgi:serine/threonine protein kinase